MTERPIAAFYACVEVAIQEQAVSLDCPNPLVWLAEIARCMGKIAGAVLWNKAVPTKGVQEAREALVATAALIVGFNEWLKPRSYAARGLEINWTKINTPEKSAEPLEYYALIVEEVGRFVATSNVLHLANAYAWCATLWELLTPTPCES